MWLMSGNVGEIVMWIGSLATLVIQTIVTPFIIVLVTLIVDWRLALALLATFPLAVPVYRYTRTLVRATLREVSAADAETASRVVGVCPGAASAAGDKAGGRAISTTASRP